MTVPDSYQQAKSISQRIDDLLGLNYSEVENLIHLNKKNKHYSEITTDKQLWIGLDIQGLQTPYSEIYEMLLKLKPELGNHWVDLGAGYGRLGYVISLLYTEVMFTGIEYVPERVAEGNRIINFWNFKNIFLVCGDLAEKNYFLPIADVYFIYDFGTQNDVETCLESLKMVAKNKKIKVIARGRGIRNWIFQSHPWLYSVNEAQHFENWSLFNS